MNEITMTLVAVGVSLLAGLISVKVKKAINRSKAMDWAKNRVQEADQSLLRCALQAQSNILHAKRSVEEMKTTLHQQVYHLIDRIRRSKEKEENVRKKIICLARAKIDKSRSKTVLMRSNFLDITRYLVQRTATEARSELKKSVVAWQEQDEKAIKSMLLKFDAGAKKFAQEMENKHVGRAVLSFVSADSKSSLKANFKNWAKKHLPSHSEIKYIVSNLKVEATKFRIY